MGYALAEAASKRKHVVTFISGPTRFKPRKVKKFVSIETADDLLKALKKELRYADCLIMCAAVGDFRPRHVFKQKVKRTKQFSLELTPNKDILSELFRYKEGKLFVGFSLETENSIKRSYEKLKAKNLDLIVSTQLKKSYNIFGDNKLDASIIDKYGFKTEIKKKKKAFIAHVLLDKIEEMWY